MSFTRFPSFFLRLFCGFLRLCAANHKTGTNVRGFARWNRLDNPLGAGSQTFAGVATSLYAEGLPVIGTGYDLADFLLGSSQSSRIQYGNPDNYLRNREFAISLNDNWRMHSRLTLQWGVRYEFFEPLVERYDRLANLDVAPGFTDAEPVTSGGSGSFSGTVNSQRP